MLEVRNKYQQLLQAKHYSNIFKQIQICKVTVLKTLI